MVATAIRLSFLEAAGDQGANRSIVTKGSAWLSSFHLMEPVGISRFHSLENLRMLAGEIVGFFNIGFQVKQPPPPCRPCQPTSICQHARPQDPAVSRTSLFAGRVALREPHPTN